MEDTETKKSKDFIKNLGWILFFVLLAGILGAMFLPKLIHASPVWPLDKNQTCAMFNYTDNQCNKYWCEWFIEGNWTYDLCLKNYTIIINNTINQTTNSSINITQIMKDYNLTYSNQTTNITSANFTEFKNYTDSQIMALRDSLVDRLENQTYPSNYVAPQEPFNWTMAVVIVLIVCGTIGFLAFANLKKPPAPKTSQFMREFDNSKFYGEKEKEKTAPQIENVEKELKQLKEEIQADKKTKKKIEEP